LSPGVPQANSAHAALPRRSRVALAAGRAAKGLSRALGRGEGGVIGGSVALRLDPAALEVLAAGREIALVSATNGKTTTTQFLATALASDGPVAHNFGGSNMANGLVTGLDATRDAACAALEVDEAYLGPITAAVAPRSITLMNLSHELTRGVSYKNEARHWRETIAHLGPGCTVIANADDPLVAWTVQPATDVVWVAGGLLWREDALVCRGCLLPLAWEAGAYRCAGCGLSRPTPTWWLQEGTIHGPDVAVPVDVRLPGRANQLNALFAVATAALYGVDPTRAVAAIAGVVDVAGRYQKYHVDGRIVELHMAKNSASWSETLNLIAADQEAALVFALEGFGITGRDTATLWDAPVELLAGRRAIVSGARRYDVAMRLQVAGVEAVPVADHLDAIRSCPRGPVKIVANYVTFNLLKKRLAS
jgi:lipid II isoglutaminyl synthase (glutamine-hydrolysing)